MNHHLSVTVRVDLDLSTVRLAVTGCLTEDSYPSLLALTLRARSLTPSGQITVDLTGSSHVEATGLNLLRAAVDHDEDDSNGRPVLFVVPEPLPFCAITGAVATVSVR
ncbi:hypothetical protein [Brachybacterium sp. UNK5269]|uniref:hypothetical protein n=1 Tax=Brachybacterium sp. UNK5269 TaxID=3408576 RepID=UPI003BB064FF